MLGQPASSHTVCRPSRRTSDLSSVYSGPVLSRVLIHSGLRSIGTWLLRTSRRRSLRPAGPIDEAGSEGGTAVSVMIPTVPRTADRPRSSAGSSRGGRPVGSGRVLRVELVRRAGGVRRGLREIVGSGRRRVQRGVGRAAGGGV